MPHSVHAAHKTIDSLDSDAILKLMDCNGKVVDFEVDARVNTEGRITIGHGNRLFPRMPHVMPDWEAPEEVRKSALNLASQVHKFFASGGDSVEDICSDEGVGATRLLIRQTISAFKENTVVSKVNFETNEDLVMAIFNLVFYSRIVSGKFGFVEMPLYTGPPSGGNTLLCYFPITFHGGRTKGRPWWTYVESLPNNYLCVP